MVRQISNYPRFRTSFDSQYVRGSKILPKSPREHFFSYFSSLWWELSCKMSFFVICEIVGLFVETLTANDKYSLCNSENLPQLIQMQLSKKQIIFCEIFAQFLNIWSRFKHFEKKVTLRAYVFSKLQSVKDVARQMSKKAHIRTPFNSQHVKGSRTLLKTSKQHLYHIF